MALVAGTRLGAYEIVSLLGAGGMGEVYRARDTRLDRTVALKILPPSLASDAQFRERFTREGRAISQLDHPHICTLYDVGEQDGTSFLVMQYLEGETLESRLKKGGLPLDQALQFAIQIANALDKAHCAGIVHRDLKPGNIMLTKSGAMLLDFGLAKATGAGAAAGLSVLPTTPPGLTAQGTILGTFQYMAPEQLEGQEADARTDVFAFGTVLYEMVTGRRAFQGGSQASLISAIMSAEPPSVATLQPLAPPVLEHLLVRCLAKKPEDRWQTARDVMKELQWIAASGSQTSAIAVPRLRRRIPWAWIAASAAIVAVTAFGAAEYLQSTPTDPHTYRATIVPPPNTNTRFDFPGWSGGILAVSPDGQRVAFIAQAADGRVQLWVRALSGLSAQPLAGAESASAPFWSPDSKFIGFFAEGKLKKIDAAGGPALILCDAEPAVSGGVGGGGTWNKDGVIVFSATRVGALQRVSSAGGQPSPVTALSADSGETAHVWPSFLPDGRHFLYFVIGSAATGVTDPNGVYVGSLDSRTERKLVMPGGSNAKYANGFLTFMRAGTLMAQPFDATRLTLSGEATPIAEQVFTGTAGATGAFSISETGVLVHESVPSVDVRSQLVWVDRNGKQLSVLGDQAEYLQIRLSPDGARAAVTIVDASTRTSDIWIYDIGRGLRTRFTFDPADDGWPVWSPDGSAIAFARGRLGVGRVYRKPSSGAGSEQLMQPSDRETEAPTSWSPDGRWLASLSPSAQTRMDIRMMPVSGDSKPFAFMQTAFDEGYADFSPDGRWVAYSSAESGLSQVYVAPFPGPGGKWQVSAAGGRIPRWRRDGKEIFFGGLDGKAMSAAVNGSGTAFEVGKVEVLFDLNTRPTAILGAAVSPFDAAADGQRFLVNRTIAQTPESASLTLVVNWPSLLKK
jgi:serine/threonine protein kinase